MQGSGLIAQSFGGSTACAPSALNRIAAGTDEGIFGWLWAGADIEKRGRKSRFILNPKLYALNPQFQIQPPNPKP